MEVLGPKVADHSPWLKRLTCLDVDANSEYSIHPGQGWDTRLKLAEARVKVPGTRVLGAE